MNIVKSMVLVSSLIVCNLSFAGIGAMKEAENLLDKMGMQDLLERSTEQMLDLQIQQNAALKPFKHVMLKFLKKHMSYESLKPDMVAIYADAFTESELKELNAFYSTPTGKKTIQKLPELMVKGSQLGALRVQQNMQELQQMIAAEAERLQQLQKTK